MDFFFLTMLQFVNRKRHFEVQIFSTVVPYLSLTIYNYIFLYYYVFTKVLFHMCNI